MRNQSLVSCVFLVLVACGGGAARPAPAPAPAADPDRRLSHAECAESVDHAIAIFEADPEMAGTAKSMRDGRDGFISQCEASATLRDRDCLMKAHDARELGLCPPPGSR
jgi:hypothetical protein